MLTLTLSLTFIHYSDTHAFYVLKFILHTLTYSLPKVSDKQYDAFKPGQYYFLSIRKSNSTTTSSISTTSKASASENISVDANTCANTENSTSKVDEASSRTPNAKGRGNLSLDIDPRVVQWHPFSAADKCEVDDKKCILFHISRVGSKGCGSFTDRLINWVSERECISGV